jgi:hypothetical protein
MGPRDFATSMARMCGCTPSANASIGKTIGGDCEACPTHGSTGGEIIKARFMRQDFFIYLAQFKLMIPGNHNPCQAGRPAGGAVD